ncbi:MAG: pyrimidine 5'-nucleotidase [Anaerolineae bacterium]
MDSARRYRFLLCDLDDTLYPANAGIMKAVGERISQFMIEHLDVLPEMAPYLRRYFRERYGTTMRGLILHYGINPERYLEFVHDLPLTNFIQPDPALSRALENITLTKAIFTNASREHAMRVLTILGVRHHFAHIIDVRDFHYHSKPHRYAYRRALQILDARPEECILVEDMPRNLVPAVAMGMFGVLVRNPYSEMEDRTSVADLYVNDVLELAEKLQSIIASPRTELVRTRQASQEAG